MTAATTLIQALKIKSDTYVVIDGKLYYIMDADDANVLVEDCYTLAEKYIPLRKMVMFKMEVITPSD